MLTLRGGMQVIAIMIPKSIKSKFPVPLITRCSCNLSARPFRVHHQDCSTNNVTHGTHARRQAAAAAATTAGCSRTAGESMPTTSAVCARPDPVRPSPRAAAATAGKPIDFPIARFCLLLIPTASNLSNQRQRTHRAAVSLALFHKEEREAGGGKDVRARARPHQPLSPNGIEQKCSYYQIKWLINSLLLMRYCQNYDFSSFPSLSRKILE